MDFGISLELLGWLVVALVALVFGVAVQLIGEARTGYEWLIAGIAFAVGAVFASEVIVAWRTFEPVWEGLALVPALIGGLVVGVVVDVATRLVTGGTYSGRPLSA